MWLLSTGPAPALTETGALSGSEAEEQVHDEREGRHEANRDVRDVRMQHGQMVVASWAAAAFAAANPPIEWRPGTGYAERSRYERFAPTF